jgi:hypothetical protein
VALVALVMLVLELDKTPEEALAKALPKITRAYLIVVLSKMPLQQTSNLFLSLEQAEQLALV